MRNWVRAGCAMALAVICAFNAAWAAPQRITSAEELKQALRSAVPGTVLELAPGRYGALVIRDFNVGGQITLRSARSNARATFSTMVLDKVHNITLENLTFDYDFSTDDKIYDRPFQIVRSTDVRVENSLFDGDLAHSRSPVDDGFPTGIGLGVRSSTNIVLQNNEVRKFYRGIAVRETKNALVVGNDVHSLRMDGITFAQVQNVQILNNHIHDFLRSLKSEDHSDMIQFWTTGTKTATRNITIKNNILNSGKGWFTQSIFMRNELVDLGQEGANMFYRNITIENNMILNAHLHGITVGETNGLKIRNNTIVRNPRSEGADDNPDLWTPRIGVAKTSRNVEITRNIVAYIVGQGAQPSWQVKENLIVQDRARMKAGFYGQVFGTAAIRAPTKTQSFLPKSGGVLLGRNIGFQPP